MHKHKTLPTEPAHTDAYQIYAGIATVLLVFFLVLFAASDFSEEKWKALVGAFHPDGVTEDAPVGVDTGEDVVKIGDLTEFEKAVSEYNIASQTQKQITVTAGTLSGNPNPEPGESVQDVTIRIHDVLEYSTDNSLKKANTYGTFDYITDQLAAYNGEISAVYVRVDSNDRNTNLDYRQNAFTRASAACEYISVKSGFPKAKLYAVTGDFSLRPDFGDYTYITEITIVAAGGTVSAAVDGISGAAAGK